MLDIGINELNEMINQAIIVIQQIEGIDVWTVRGFLKEIIKTVENETLPEGRYQSILLNLRDLIPKEIQTNSKPINQIFSFLEKRSK